MNCDKLTFIIHFYVKEFGNEECPTADGFLETIFLYGENPFIPKTY